MTNDTDRVFSQMLEAMRPALGHAYTDAKATGCGYMRVTFNDDTGMVEVENLHPSKVLVWNETKENEDP